MIFFLLLPWEVVKTTRLSMLYTPDTNAVITHKLIPESKCCSWLYNKVMLLHIRLDCHQQFKHKST